jgi:hypothetical protein
LVELESSGGHLCNHYYDVGGGNGSYWGLEYQISGENKPWPPVCMHSFFAAAAQHPFYQTSLGLYSPPSGRCKAQE